MADYTGALIQLGTLAASLLAQKKQTKDKEKRENESYARDSGRTREDTRFNLLMQRAQEMGTPGAGYLATAARADKSIGREGEDLKRNQALYEDQHATDYLNPQVLGMLGKSLAQPTQYDAPQPYSQRVTQDIAAPATGMTAGALAPSAAAAGVSAGAGSALEEAMRKYGYR